VAVNKSKNFQIFKIFKLVRIWEFLGHHKPPTTQGEHLKHDLQAALRVGLQAKSVELAGFVIRINY